jgi:hypothetical protein
MLPQKYKREEGFFKQKTAWNCLIMWGEGMFGQLKQGCQSNPCYSLTAD